MRNCPFDGNGERPCPVDEQMPYGILNRVCEPNGYGESCAAIVGQSLLAKTISIQTMESTFDTDLGHIEGYFRLTQVPSGDPPEQVRASISKQSFPLRELRPVVDERVAVSHVDLVLSLMNSEKLETANWYAQFSREQGDNFLGWWLFDQSEGQINKLSEPKRSIDVYDTSFRMGSAALWNSIAPPLLLVRELNNPPGTRPIAELFQS